MKVSTILLLIFTILITITFTTLSDENNNEVIFNDDYKNINNEIIKIKCSFSYLKKSFSDYLPFFGATWEEVESNFKCEEVRDFVIEKERKRLKLDIQSVPQREGISNGTLIFYGFYIQPPYVFKIDTNIGKILINDGIVSPVSIQDIEEPENRKDRKEYSKNGDDFLYKLMKYEHNLERIEVSKINRKIFHLLKTMRKQEVLHEIQEYLSKMKLENNIQDYKFYDVDNLFYDLNYNYSHDYKINEKYFYNGQVYSPKDLLLQKYNNTAIEKLIKKKKDELSKSLLIEKQLYYDSLQKIDDVLIVYPNTKSFRKLKSINKLLLSILSNGDEYQKIFYIDQILNEHTVLAELLVFNFKNEDALYLLKKINCLIETKNE